MNEVKKSGKKNRPPFISTAILALLTISTFTVGNPPQCPDNYSQAQVDASNCIIGANIGLGLLVLFVLIPLSTIVLALWAVFLVRKARKK